MVVCELESYWGYISVGGYLSVVDAVCACTCGLRLMRNLAVVFGFMVGSWWSAHV